MATDGEPGRWCVIRRRRDGMKERDYRGAKKSGRWSGRLGEMGHLGKKRRTMKLRWKWAVCARWTKGLLQIRSIRRRTMQRRRKQEKMRFNWWKILINGHFFKVVVWILRQKIYLRLKISQRLRRMSLNLNYRLSTSFPYTFCIVHHKRLHMPKRN